MNLKRSIALSMFFPKSRSDANAFKRALEFLKEWPMDSVEFYYDGENRKEVAAALEKSGYLGIYIAVIPLKEQNLSLCALDDNHRKQAVLLAQRCIDEAFELGCRGVMMNSGRNPGKGRVDEGIKSFMQSVKELQKYIGTRSIHLLLEPCDSQIEAKNLLGPTRLSVDVTRALRKDIPDFSLVLDTAHVYEEGEDFLQAVQNALDCCDHLHFANCVVSDSSDPFYGDKHIGFDHPGSAFSYFDLFRIFKALEELYQGRECRIALEVLCREPDPEQYFRKVAAQMPWFWQMNDRRTT